MSRQRESAQRKSMGYSTPLSKGAVVKQVRSTKQQRTQEEAVSAEFRWMLAIIIFAVALGVLLGLPLAPFWDAPLAMLVVVSAMWFGRAEGNKKQLTGK